MIGAGKHSGYRPMGEITEEDMIKTQHLLGQVFLIFDNVDEIEKRLAAIKKESNELHKRLDDIADGDER